VESGRGFRAIIDAHLARERRAIRRVRRKRRRETTSPERKSCDTAPVAGFHRHMEIAQPDEHGAARRLGEVEMRRSQRSGSTPSSSGLLTPVTASIDFLPQEAEGALVSFSGNAREHLGITPWIGALGFLPWLRKTFERALAAAPTVELQDAWARGAGPLVLSSRSSTCSGRITRYAR